MRGEGIFLYSCVNKKLMVKRILGFILAALGFLIMIFFRKYTGNFIPYPILILPIGAIMLLVGSILIGMTPTYRQQKASEESKNFVADIKQNGEKILVDLAKCEIKENDYSEMRLPDGRREADLSDFEAMGRGEAAGEKLTEIDQTVLVYTYEYNGKEEKFRSEIIPKTEEDIRIPLYLQKTTTLYVDKTDRSKYYFDLEFLKREE